MNPLYSHKMVSYGNKDGRASPTSDLISTASQTFTFHSFSVCYKGTVDSGQIHKPYCSIVHWSIWGSIQLHWPHNWSRPLCCGKHFTRLASILINSLLLIMYLIDQFGPWVNWSIILIFFCCCCGVVSNEGQTAIGSLALCATTKSFQIICPP